MAEAGSAPQLGVYQRVARRGGFHRVEVFGGCECGRSGAVLIFLAGHSEGRPEPSCVVSGVL